MTRIARLSLLAATAASLFAQSVRVRTFELDWAIIEQPYRASIDTEVDGACPAQGNLTLSLVKGTLPAGLQLNDFGLTGTPAELGVFSFTIKAQTACDSASKDLTLIVTGRPILRVSQSELHFECRLDGPASDGQAVLVASTWPRLPYTVTADGDDWLRFDMANGRTPPRGSSLTGDSVIVHAEPGRLPPGVYHGTLEFSAPMSANQPTIAVTLTVKAKN
jgi:hypothetical protein